MCIPSGFYAPFTRFAACLAAVMILVAVLPSAALAEDSLMAGGATLAIPSINLTASIINAPLDPTIGTWATGHLGSSVGHFEHTPWLGEHGNMVLGGHATNTEGAPSIFYALDQIQVGDSITVSQGGAVQEYVVTGLRLVGLNDLRVLNSTRRDTLTLMTCAGFNGATGTYDLRLVVTARRIT
jgi:LPXTG-site transpeptidase (sortase) family protein